MHYFRDHPLFWSLLSTEIATISCMVSENCITVCAYAYHIFDSFLVVYVLQLLNFDHILRVNVCRDQNFDLCIFLSCTKMV